MGGTRAMVSPLCIFDTSKGPGFRGFGTAVCRTPAVGGGTAFSNHKSTQVENLNFTNRNSKRLLQGNATLNERDIHS